MSRIAKRIINIPKEVKTNLETSSGGEIFFWVSGIKGNSRKIKIPLGVEIKEKEKDLFTTFKNKESSVIAGTINSLIVNAIKGINSGYSCSLEVRGVGNKVEKKDETLFFHLGKTHPIIVNIPKELEVSVPSQNREIKINGIDKQEVFAFAAILRSLIKPNAYHEKGVYFQGQKVKLKPTKSVSKTGK